MSYKVIFCGTPQFAVPSLKALHGDADFEVDLVLSQPDRPSGRGKHMKASPVKKTAEDLGLEVWTPEKVKEEEFLQKLATRKADLAVVVAYGQILPQKFLDMFPRGCVNIHSSLLPRWRGAAPMQRAIMAGDAVTGVSLQIIVPQLDAGDVIGEREIEISESMGAMELYIRLKEIGCELLKKELKEFLSGDRKAKPQDPQNVVVAPKIQKSEAMIDWKDSATNIHNKVRGLDMGGPFAMTVFRQKQLKVHKTRFVPEASSEKAGTISTVEKNSFFVQCGDGQLELLEVQPESKAKMNVADFIRGYQPESGEELA